MDNNITYDEVLVAIEGARLNLERIEDGLKNEERSTQWARERLLEVGSELISDMIT